MNLDEIEKDVGYIAEQLEWTRTQHYGVWHPEKGWLTVGATRLFYTSSRAVAEAQRHAILQTSWVEQMAAPGYEVRCIEEWADERR